MAWLRVLKAHNVIFMSWFLPGWLQARTPWPLQAQRYLYASMRPQDTQQQTNQIHQSRPLTPANSTLSLCSFIRGSLQCDVGLMCSLGLGLLCSLGLLVLVECGGCAWAVYEWCDALGKVSTVLKMFSYNWILVFFGSSLNSCVLWVLSSCVLWVLDSCVLCILVSCVLWVLDYIFLSNIFRASVQNLHATLLINC